MVSKPVSLEQISAHVQSKSHLYDAMVAEGWVMPAKKSAFVTLKAIYQIRRREMWIPRREDIKEAALCARPPPIKQLVAFIRDAVEDRVVNTNYVTHPQEEAKHAAKLTLCEAMEKQAPDQRWLVQALKVLVKDHAIFKKSYAYYRPVSAVTVYNIAALSNDDGLFDGLPVLPDHIRARGKRLRLTKPERQKLQLEYLEHRQLQTYRKLQQLRTQIAEGNRQDHEQSHSEIGGNFGNQLPAAAAQLEEAKHGQGQLGRPNGGFNPGHFGGQLNYSTISELNGQGLHAGGLALHQATNAASFHGDTSRMMEGVEAAAASMAAHPNIIGNFEPHEDDAEDYVLDEVAGTP